MAVDVQPSSAARRLLRDMRSMQLSPIPTVSAAFASDDNIFVVHCNIFPQFGPFSGLPYHCILRFSERYPIDPPTLEISVVLPHPNVFSRTFVCLDMIEKAYSDVPYTGWSSAYSLQSLLLQIQTFLFDDVVPQMYDHLPPITNYSARFSGSFFQQHIQEVRNYQCPSCPHRGAHAPFPTQPLIAQQFSGVSNGSSAQPINCLAASINLLHSLPDDLLQFVSDFLAYDDLHKLQAISQSFSSFMKRRHILERFEICCFHSKSNLSEDILGLGISADFHGSSIKQSEQQNEKPKQVKSLYACMDLLSYSAFSRDGVRLGVWKEKFTHFLPLAFNNIHSLKSVPILESQLSSLFAQPFTPVLALDCLIKLMNSTIVNFMQDVPENLYSVNTWDPKLMIYHERKLVGTNHHASERALQAYVHFHQLLLACASKYPEIQKCVHDRVHTFASSPSGRHKKSTPDLGELLILLGLHSSFGGEQSWETVRELFIAELFARNVLWIVRKHEYLATVLADEWKQSQANCHRLTRSFESSKTGIRLVSFQVFFLRFMTRADAASLLEIYNSNLGRVSHHDVHLLQLHAKLVLQIKHYGHFFELIGLDLSARKQMMSEPSIVAKMLCVAVQTSSSSGYHHVRSKLQPNRDCLCELIAGQKAGKIKCVHSRSKFSRLGYLCDTFDASEEKSDKQAAYPAAASTNSKRRTTNTQSSSSNAQSCSSKPSSSSSSKGSKQKSTNPFDLLIDDSEEDDD